ncbi:MAG: hypothetical protein JNN11_01570 [Candidatus Doudnabacteria bacterium]|nr:hypothetical protein [Candidatus Doudnabacteria bacterium]
MFTCVLWFSKFVEVSRHFDKLVAQGNWEGITMHTPNQMWQPQQVGRMMLIPVKRDILPKNFNARQQLPILKISFSDQSPVAIINTLRHFGAIRISDTGVIIDEEWLAKLVGTIAPKAAA